MRIYLDLCVFKRPFDDQGQERIALETSIFIYLLEKIEKGSYNLVISDVLVYENNKDPDMERRYRVNSYFCLAREIAEITESVVERGKVMRELGFSDLDALHIAAAEGAEVDYFITCDDEILKVYKLNKAGINVCIKSLREFIAEEVG